MDIVKDQNQAEQTDESLLWLEGFFVENTPEKRQDRNVYVYVCLWVYFLKMNSKWKGEKKEEIWVNLWDCHNLWEFKKAIAFSGANS